MDRKAVLQELELVDRMGHALVEMGQEMISQAVKIRKVVNEAQTPELPGIQSPDETPDAQTNKSVPCVQMTFNFHL